MDKIFSDFGLLLEQDKQPMFMGVRPDPNTIRWIRGIIERYKVPNHCPDASFHTTLIYSRKPTVLPKLQSHKLYKASFNKLEIFNTRDGKRCLVIRLDSPELQTRHRQLMQDLDASYDFDQFLPHITLSYDVGESFRAPSDIPPRKAIYLEREYYEILSDE
jgi:2'-5' RNA ligase